MALTTRARRGLVGGMLAALVAGSTSVPGVIRAADLGDPSSVVLDSLPADAVGGGSLTRAIDTVITGSGTTSDVHFAWSGWMFELAAADGAPLTAGVYTGAQRAPFRQAGHPGLDVSAPGRGCNTVAGSFTVLDPPVFDTDGTTLLQFAADFVQLCGEDPAQALHGAIRFHSTKQVKMLRVSGPTTFAAQEVATTSAPASYAVTNVGTVPATVGAISVGGTDAGAFAVTDGGCIGAAVAVGGTCSFSATFTPAVVGTAGATLITADDTDLGGRSFPVTGTGLAAPPPDTSVDAVSVGVTPTKFYPYADRYLDTASIGGTLGEAATVSISIYSTATGKRVRLVSLGARTGTYAWPWNGRSSSGTAQPAGRYRVVQTLQDALGNTKSVTTYVTVSSRRVAWRTVTLSKSGRSATAGGAAGGGWFRLTASSYANGARIYSGSAYAALGYAFSVPSALAYRSFTWQVVGRSTNGRRAVIGLQDYRIGSGWYLENFAPLAPTGTAYGTHKIAVSPTGHRSGRTVHGTVAVIYSGGAAGFDIQAVKLVVTYAVWR